MKKRSGKFLTWVNHGQFYGDTLFAVGLTYDEIMSRLKKHKNKDWHIAIRDDRDKIDGRAWANCFWRTVYKGKKKSTYSYIIIRDRFDFSDYSMCALAHEIVHLCQFYLTDFIERDREIECEAYFHTHIMKQCLALMRNK